MAEPLCQHFQGAKKRWDGEQDDKSAEDHVFVSSITETLDCRPMWTWIVSHLTWVFFFLEDYLLLETSQIMATLLLSLIHSLNPSTPGYFIPTWPWTSKVPLLRMHNGNRERDRERDSVPPTCKLGDHNPWVRKAEDKSVDEEESDVKTGPERRDGEEPSWIPVPDNSPSLKSSCKPTLGWCEKCTFLIRQVTDWKKILGE